MSAHGYRHDPQPLRLVRAALTVAEEPRWGAVTAGESLDSAHRCPGGGIMLAARQLMEQYGVGIPSTSAARRHARRWVRPYDIAEATNAAWMHRFAIQFAHLQPEAGEADAAAAARQWSRQADHLDADEAAEIAAMWWRLQARMAAVRELLDDDGPPPVDPPGARVAALGGTHHARQQLARIDERIAEGRLRIERLGRVLQNPARGNGDRGMRRTLELLLDAQDTLRALRRVVASALPDEAGGVSG